MTYTYMLISSTILMIVTRGFTWSVSAYITTYESFFMTTNKLQDKVFAFYRKECGYTPSVVQYKLLFNKAPQQLLFFFWFLLSGGNIILLSMVNGRCYKASKLVFDNFLCTLSLAQEEKIHYVALESFILIACNICLSSTIFYR